MHLQRTLGSLLLLLLAVPPLAAQSAAPAGSLTIWLIPSEPPESVTPAVGGGVIEQIEEFNQVYGKDRPVTVLNTTVPLLRDQLVAWNRDYAVPTWQIIKGQTHTLQALSQFAAERHVHINVRFVSWARVFEELENAAQARRSGQAEAEYAPDVAQVGSTWVKHFSAEGLLLPQQGADYQRLKWRGPPDAPPLSLRLHTDVRLLFYWRRRHSEEPTANRFTLKADDWPALLDSIRKRVLEAGAAPSQPMVMPIGRSQNLLHDYIPLIWAGGAEFLHLASARVNLTKPESLAVPLLIARNTLLRDEKQQPHRLIAFPEIGHDEAANFFTQGDYLATIEPVDFIKRWYKLFQQHPPPAYARGGAKLPADAFWKYAGAAVPPVTFKGGSDLIVLAGTPRPESAFALMTYLATYEPYTKTLAELGFLPAQREDYGIEELVKTLAGDGGAAQSETAEFAATLRQALRAGREYPEFADWPKELESTDVLESFQQLWRRIGEWDETEKGLARIKAAAADTELTINRRINRRVRWWEEWKNALPWFGLALSAFVGLGLVQRQRYRHRQAQARMEANVLAERAQALDYVRKVRGFSSNALYVVYETHNLIRNPFRRSDETDRKAADKAIALVAGLQGWRRGCDERNWEDTPLATVVWRAIVIALESCYEPLLFRAWEQARQPDARTFLAEKGLLRGVREVSAGLPPFYFEVACPAEVSVAMPFMLEQALVCLLQNAIKVSRAPTGYQPIAVTYDHAAKLVSVINQGRSLYAANSELCAALNNSSDLDEFERRIDVLLRSSVEPKPGIGLVEAYSIATQCYGGLVVDQHQPKVSIRLHSNGQEVKR